MRFKIVGEKVSAGVKYFAGKDARHLVLIGVEDLNEQLIDFYVPAEIEGMQVGCEVQIHLREIRKGRGEHMLGNGELINRPNESK